MKRFRENLKSLEILLGWSILEYLDPYFLNTLTHIKLHDYDCSHYAKDKINDNTWHEERFWQVNLYNLSQKKFGHLKKCPSHMVALTI